MAHWTKGNIPDLNGKVCIVTGANSGIGYESALALAEKGATVIMACRNPERGQRALAAIQQAVPAAHLQLMTLDLASLKSIHDFAETFKHQYQRLDILINNGGTVVAGHHQTKDGFESQLGTNHLGHFALTGQLLEVLLQTPASRIVTVSSRMHATAKIAWDDLMSERAYNAMTTYGQSKLANLLFAIELNRRLAAKGTSTKSIAVHPGLARTRWVDNNLEGVMKPIGNILSLTYQSASMASLPLLYAAVDSTIKSGGYYGPEHDTKGYPVEVKASGVAYDEAEAKRLWELSEKLTGVKYEALNTANAA